MSEYETTMAVFNPISSAPQPPQPPVVGHWALVNTCATPAGDEPGYVYLFWSWKRAGK